MFSRPSVLLLAFAMTFNAFGADLIRWTGSEDPNSNLSHILSVLSAKTGHTFVEADFKLLEERDLAFNHYQYYQQILGGVPVDGKSIRIWSDLNNRSAIQVESYLDTETPPTNILLNSFRSVNQNVLTADETRRIARNITASTDDPTFRGIEWKDSWVSGKLVRIVTVKGKRGKHRLVISLAKHDVLSADYVEFPQGDRSEEMSLNALVFPIYEETAGTGEIQTRVPVVLRHVHTQIADTSGDIYAPLKTQRYFEDKLSSTKGSTVEGRAAGFWSMAFLKQEAAQIRATLPIVENTLDKGLLLQGRYATINIHPDAFTAYKGINFTPKASEAFFPNWVDGDPAEMIPGSAFYGKPLFSAAEVLTRPARRLPDHDPASYINDGFDEIQVYYAINTLMESLKQYGFSDPELSTRAFNAFLFNPDIGSRNNAFYTDDTINFTNYSPGAQNFARDNSTIWHELGHGIMDRLMGDRIELGDTGGLSEGMADFVAALIIQDVTKGVPFPGSTKFRIINKTGFNLTNEAHDDGEAYGGAMKDFLDAALVADPENGLHKVTDVVLEAMRLARDYPKLTANDWFNHILFADSLGRAGVRAPGEMKVSLLKALTGRNFRLDGGTTASFKLVNDADGKEVGAGSAGSRGKPIATTIAPDGTADFNLSITVQSSDEYKFAYPVTVRVAYNDGALEGPIHWKDEEKGPILLTINSDGETAHTTVTMTGKCDFSNRADGSCSDYIYVQVFNQGGTRPVAKKRFYTRLVNPTAPPVVQTAR